MYTSFSDAYWPRVLLPLAVLGGIISPLLPIAVYGNSRPVLKGESFFPPQGGNSLFLSLNEQPGKQHSLIFPQSVLDGIPPSPNSLLAKILGACLLLHRFY